MTKPPQISVIMASYNHADYIGEAIESVRQQDLKDWELLIADDASTDHTRHVLESFKEDPRIKIFPFKINRQYHMRNFAADHARGKYIAFLNSDDLFLAGKLSKQVDFLERNSRFSAVFTQVQCVNEKGTRIPEHPLETTFAVGNQTRHAWLRHFFISGNCLCISSAVIRRTCLETVARFNPLLIQISDLDLWIKTCMQGDIHIIPEKLTCMRILKNNKNLSTASPAVLSRLVLENQHTYSHYFSPEGIQQAAEIFPEWKNTLPEDIPAWRSYLLCSKLIAMPRRSAKLAGFLQLHELLSNPETAAALMQKNPRLLRHLFLWEGASDLDGKRPYCQWSIRVLDPKDKDCKKNMYSYWTAALEKNTVCLSIPNRQSPARLLLAVEGKQIPFCFQQIRFYDQSTGTCIFQMDAPELSNATPFFNCIQKSALFRKITKRRNPKNIFHLPEIDFSKFSSKWIDLEIDCVPIR